MNTITLVGNITADPELRYTPNGNAVAKFSIAVVKNKDKNSGEWISDFFNCITWNSLAENIAASLQRGSRVILTGKVVVEKWTDDNGNKKQSVKIRVESMGPDLAFASCTIEKNSKDRSQQDREETESIVDEIPW